MLSLNYENINYVMTQILKLSCVSFSYVSISYVLAVIKYNLNPFFRVTLLPLNFLYYRRLKVLSLINGPPCAYEHAFIER